MLIGFAQLMMWEAGHPFETGNYEQFEYSETLQIILLLISIVVLLIVSRHDPTLRPLTLCLAFFLSAMFMRENDWIADLFGQKTLHHLLIWSMLGIFILVLFYFRKGLSVALREWMDNPGKGYIECGLLTVLVFAQLFGRKSYWTVVMNHGFERWVKNAVEEGVELLGYSLILFGTMDLFFACRRRITQTSQAVETTGNLPKSGSDQ